jgi:glycosyltransferase involved in cell wall biosynthesis
MKKIALFHPWIKSKGGSERTILEFLKDKNYSVDLYTWVYDKNNTFPEFEKFKINVIAPKIAKKISKSFLLRGLFLPISLFSKIPLENYDLFLISTSGVGELITLRNYKPKKTFAYVYTPLRATYKEDVKWNLRNRYKNIFSKIIYLIFVDIYRIFEKIAWEKIDLAIFISELSRKRAIDNNLLKDKENYIVYPPVNVNRYKKIKTKRENYFLYISRFNPLKRQDILIEAWKKFSNEYPQYKLILAGGEENRPYLEKLRKMAETTKRLEIKSNLEDNELLKLYSNCLAVVFIPFMEDFGIVPFEALALGKPVIVSETGGYFQMIKKYKQVFSVKEKRDEKDMIEEVYLSLKNFITSNIKSKKVNLEYLNEENFIKNINKILDKKA